MAARRHSYTIEQANALIPQVRAVLLQLAMEQRRMDAAHAEMHRYLAGNGDPGSSAEADRLEREAADIGEVDFPGERDGQPVWLCWRLADPAVAHWHGTDEGYASRKPW